MPEHGELGRQLAERAGPGRMVATRHRSAPAMLPWRRAGRRPALTSEDFPLPEGPSTARNREPRSFSRSCATSPSRPKKRSRSASSNGRRPRYGQTACSAVVAGGPGATPCTASTSWRTTSSPPMPARRSSQLRRRRNGGSSTVGSNGTPAPGRRTGTTRYPGRLADRSSATFSSCRAQSPMPEGPTKTRQPSLRARPSASRPASRRPPRCANDRTRRSGSLRQATRQLLDGIDVDAVVRQEDVVVTFALRGSVSRTGWVT